MNQFKFDQLLCQLTQLKFFKEMEGGASPLKTPRRHTIMKISFSPHNYYFSAYREQARFQFNLS